MKKKFITKTKKNKTTIRSEILRAITIFSGLSSAILLFGSIFFISYYAMTLLGITGILGTALMVGSFITLSAVSSYAGLKLGSLVNNLLRKIVKPKNKSINKNAAKINNTPTIHNTKDQKIKNDFRQNINKDTKFDAEKHIENENKINTENLTAEPVDQEKTINKTCEK